MKRTNYNQSIINNLEEFFKENWPQIVILIGLTVILSLFFQSGRSLQYSYNIDDIAREPIIAPFNYPILKSEEKLEADLSEALKSEPFIFNRKQDIVDEQSSELTEFFILIDKIRTANRDLLNSRNLVYDYRYTEKFQEAKSMATADSAYLAEQVNAFYNRYSFAKDKVDWNLFLKPVSQGGPEYSLRDFENEILQICRNRWAVGILDIQKSKVISIDLAVDQGDIPTLFKPVELNDLNQAWTDARVDITKIYSDETDMRRDLGYDLIIEFMKPNLIYDKETTERRQKARQDRIPRSQGIVLKDEMIVNANQRINQEDLQKLRLLAVEISKENRTLGLKESFKTYLGRLFVIGIVVSFFFTFLLTYRSHVFQKWRMVLVIG